MLTLFFSCEKATVKPVHQKYPNDVQDIPKRINLIKTKDRKLRETNIVCHVYRGK